MEIPTQSSEELLQTADEELSKRHITAALRLFGRAEQMGAAPDQCAAGRWAAWMLAGDYLSAWHESDAIHARGEWDPHRFWTGESVVGKRLIVRCLHGLGDAVQMLRYLPLLQHRCADVIVEVPPRLLPLMDCFEGVGHVITWGDQAPALQPIWDVQIEIMELPYLFRTSVPDLPVAINYLRLPKGALQWAASGMGPATGPRVGIVWSASEWDTTRRLPIGCLLQLLAVPALEFWNLQGGMQHELGRAEPALLNVRDAASLGDGLRTLAAVVGQMDLVLTVDTLAAHLAGALGRETWVLLQHRADWRWMHGRDDSPWYPTMRLFRQPAQDDWSSLTLQICEALQIWAEGRR